MSIPEHIVSPTRRLSTAQVAALKALIPGQRIQVVQTVRVGAKKWTTTVPGIFRHIDYLATGVTTDRVPEDDIVMPMLHFTKDNGELTSIAIDENSDVKPA